MDGEIEGHENLGINYRTVINQRKTFACNFRGKEQRKKREGEKILLSPW